MMTWEFKRRNTAQQDSIAEVAFGQSGTEEWQ